MVNGERLNLQTQIAPDAVRPFVSLLDEIGPTQKLTLLLDTNGGSTSAAWRLINLIRSFCDELEVIVPMKAMSAGTLMSLGADRIVMTKQAALGPIDPSLNSHPFAPTTKLPTGQQAQLPVSAEAVRGYIDEVKKDVKEDAAIAAVWTHLADKLHPTVLGDIFRIGEQIRQLASELIKAQVEDHDKQQEIIQLLCSDSGSHDYTINRRKADAIGLKVEKPSAELYQKLSSLMDYYHQDLRTLEPYTLQGLLAPGAPSSNYSLIRGFIESKDKCYGFVSEGEVIAQQQQAGQSAPAQTLVDNRTFEGWKLL
jgi:predicted transcriptional regulator